MRCMQKPMQNTRVQHGQPTNKTVYSFLKVYILFIIGLPELQFFLHPYLTLYSQQTPFCMDHHRLLVGFHLQNSRHCLHPLKT